MLRFPQRKEAFMKRTLVLVAVLFLIGALAAWAEGNPAGSPAAAAPAPAGSCTLPNLAGLSPDRTAVAPPGAGLQMSPPDASTAAGIPACPTTFSCSSLAGCGSSMVCSLTAMGKCCVSGDAILCCANTLFVERCPCKCVSEDCPRLCDSSTQVSLSCS